MSGEQQPLLSGKPADAIPLRPQRRSGTGPLTASNYGSGNLAASPASAALQDSPGRVRARLSVAGTADAKDRLSPVAPIDGPWKRLSKSWGAAHAANRRHSGRSESDREEEEAADRQLSGLIQESSPSPTATPSPANAAHKDKRRSKDLSSSSADGKSSAAASHEKPAHPEGTEMHRQRSLTQLSQARASAIAASTHTTTASVSHPHYGATHDNNANGSSLPPASSAAALAAGTMSRTSSTTSNPGGPLSPPHGGSANNGGDGGSGPNGANNGGDGKKAAADANSNATDVLDTMEFDDTDSWHETIEELTNPVGRYRRVWLLLIFLFVLYNAIIIPFSLAFQSLWSDWSFFITIAFFFYLGDLFFCLDVALYFFTPYTRDGMYERNLDDIRRHYLRSWFAVDLISSVPFDLLFIPFGLKAVLLVRMTRFLRFVKIDLYFSVWEQYSTKAPQAVRLIKLMLGVMLILHWLACFWFYAGYAYGFGTTTWLPPHEFRHADLTTQYIVSLWWSTNIITQVGGDPGLPTNNFERVADFWISFIAVFVVAVVIGSVTELITEFSADESELRAKLSTLNHFMYARRLPEELQERIRNYYRALWSRRGVNDDGSNSILEALPSNLRTEVSLIMNQDILGKVPIFQGSSPGFINSLVLRLKPQTYTPREFIVKQGEIGSEMFFISRGQVIVMAGRPEKLVGRIGEGGFFGEIAVLQENAQRTASIQAVNFCDVFVLTHEDLQLMFRTFPQEKAIIMHVAETRRAKDLLRKTLQDPQLLARESTEGFHDPLLINLLIELFQPLDLTYMQRKTPAGSAVSTTLTLTGLRIDEHGEIVVGDENESALSEDEMARQGLIFSPEDRSETIYFIGKGCVDIFAHKEFEEAGESHQRKHIVRDEHLDGSTCSSSSNSQTDSDSDSCTDTEVENSGDDDEDGGARLSRPEHVIRLTEGHFFGGIRAAENYRVSAVLPEEFRDDAIIFALTAQDLKQVQTYYEHAYGPPPPKLSRQRSGESLHKSASSVSLGSSSEDHVEWTSDQEDAAAAARLSLKKSLVVWLQRHRTPLDYVKSMVSLQVHTQHIQSITTQKSLNWKMLLKIIMHKSKAGVKAAAKALAAKAGAGGSSNSLNTQVPPAAGKKHEDSGTSESKTTDPTDSASSGSDNAIHVASLPPLPIPEEVITTAGASPTAAPHAASPADKPAEPKPASSKTTDPAAPASLTSPTAVAGTPHRPRHAHRREHTAHTILIVSPATSPNISAEPYQAAAYSDSQVWDKQGQPAGTPVPGDTAGAPGAAAASSHTSSSHQTLSAPALNNNNTLAPTVQKQPSLIRAVSLGGAGLPTSPLSPLTHRSIRGTSASQDISERLAEADMAVNRPGATGRVRSGPHGVGGSDDVFLDVAEPLSASDARHSALRRRAESSSSPAIGAPQPAPSLDWLTGTTTSPGTREVDSALVGSPSGSTRQSLSVARPAGVQRTPSVPPTNASGSLHPRTGQPAPPMTSRSREGRGSFAFGSAGPSSSVAGAHQPFSFLLSLPQTPQHGNNGGVSSASTGSLGMPPLTPMSPSMSPVKRGSGSAAPLSMAKRQSMAAAAKRAEFLEKSLSMLTSEELLLLANKASVHLYARLHQQQAASSNVAPPPGDVGGIMRSASTMVSPTYHNRP